MDQNRFHTMTRVLSGVPSRRHLLRLLAGTGLGLGVTRLPESEAAKKKRKHTSKNTKGLCQKNGAPCTNPGKKCKKEYCLNAPFTIEAKWTEEADHEAYLFVPPQNATTGPGPHIYPFCNQGNSRCEEEYPFACVDKDEYEIGAEVTTIYRLLPGTYEYWVELGETTPAGGVTVVLRDNDGRVLRRWASPAKPSPQDQGWHVFDVDGRTGRVTSIDVLLAAQKGLPDDAYDPHTLVCPQ